MAYFEIDLTPDGINNATIVGTATEWIVDSETHLDLIIWNEAETLVDVQLLGGHTDLDWVLHPTIYEDEHDEPKWRRYAIDNSNALGPFLNIYALQPGAIFPIRLTNPLPNGNRNWIDTGGCDMQVRGHGTNIFNGGRVYVAGHSPASAT